MGIALGLAAATVMGHKQVKTEDETTPMKTEGEGLNVELHTEDDGDKAEGGDWITVEKVPSVPELSSLDAGTHPGNHLGDGSVSTSVPAGVLPATVSVSA